MRLLALALVLLVPAVAAAKGEDEKAGWVSLFDGKTTKGWRGFRKDAFPEKGWAVENGTLRRLPGSDKPGDIVTTDEYDSFELKLDWKIAPKGNSGIKYLVDEAMVKPGEGALGFEYQVLDDGGHPDAKMGKDGNRTTAGLYDLIAPKNKPPSPPGVWHTTRILVDGNHVEHWLNGKKVVEYERGSPALKALIAESKFKTKPGFGDQKKGRILLQDHGDEVAYRNIKVRRIGK